MKRHTRPYGCTFPDCFKAFGSRNDWKRHEASQHFLHDMWKCTLSGPSGQRCGVISWDPRQLTDHLEQNHQMTLGDTRVRECCEAMHLGANASRRFFCGFCNAFVQQRPEDLHNALEARCKHIGDHYDRGFHVNDWVCIEADRPKGQLAMRNEGKGKAQVA